MLKSRRALAAFVLLFAGQSGCEKRDRAVPPAPPSLPPLSAVKGPPPPSQSVPAMPSGHAAMLQGVKPMQAEAPETVLASGVIKVSDAVKANVKMGATLFLSGRGVGQGGQPGMVLLAKKLMVNANDIAFELTPNDLMGMGGVPTGPVQLTARVDQDEDASTKQVGDVEGLLGPVTLPARSLTIVLTTVRKEGSGPPSDATFGHGAMPPEHGALPAGHMPIPGAHGDLPPGHVPVAPAAAPPTAVAPASPAARTMPPATGTKPPGHP